ncbi:PHP domain-containing protein, partial [Streptomyces nanshensis]
MSGFTHLHTASGFSLRYGASHPERLVERAAGRGMGALALTDRDTLAGAIRFAKACMGAEGEIKGGGDGGGDRVRPIFGVDLAVTPYGEKVRRTVRPRTPARGGAFVDESAPRVTFLARDGAHAWAELCRLVTAAHARSGTADGARGAGGAGGVGEAGGPLDGSGPLSVAGPPVVGRGALPADGLTVLLGPASEVGRALAAGRPDRAAALLAPWRELYGDALRLEAVDHGRPGAGAGSLRLAARTLGF